MKFQYTSCNETFEAEVDERWGVELNTLDRQDYNSERKDHRTDRKYEHGKPMTVDEYESVEHSGAKKKSGAPRYSSLLDEIIRKEDNERLYAAVKQLPPKQRALIIAIFFDDWREVDYAREKATEKSAVSQMKDRALKNLKKFLKTR